MNFTHRIDRVFSFGDTYSYDNINATIGDYQVFGEYLHCVEEEYHRNSPSNGTFDDFAQKIDAMWSTEPVWNASSFSKIPSHYDDPDAPVIWIVDGGSEEAIARDAPGVLPNILSKSGALIFVFFLE
ncbi:hypothetical protein FHETE_9746 [Fusarium heterosporum]|uniref:Uncharacterized protein n=1 Tax=Fusarium heterosporum TaxID=42747 RepID=A0A8H5WG24_FUSHE|nr:hypothetical protein FHETE_9746 [Fusarium heterosporum]